VSTLDPPSMSDIGPEQLAPRRRIVSIVFIAIAALLVTGGVLLKAGAPAPEEIVTASAEALSVQVLSVREASVLPHVELNGLLEAQRQVELFAEVPGRVLEVGAEELDRVEAGQLLVRMDPLLAEVAIKRAKAAIARAASEGQFARSNLDRNQGLAGRNVASRAALDGAENASRLAEAQRLDAQASLALAENDLANKTVVAPFAGVLRDFPVEQDEYIQAGERIGELLDVSGLRVKLGLSDRQIVAVEKGTEVDLAAAARPGERFVGRVLRVGSAIDMNTRKFPIEIEVDNEAGLLLPGMVVRINLALGSARQRMALPLDAIVDEFGLKHVFVIESASDAEGAAHVARKRRVKLREIPFDPTRYEVLGGLADGERIAISSVRQLRDGVAVRPIHTPDRIGSLESTE
jgi:membrane fusion protein (multidrug efflux system)